MDVADAGTTAANGRYTNRGSFNTKYYYNLQGQSDSTTLYALVWTGAVWKITSFNGTSLYESTDDTTYPWDAVFTATGGAGPVPTVNQDVIILASSWESISLSNQGFPITFLNSPPTWSVPQIKQYVASQISNTVPFASQIVAGETYLDVNPDVATLPIAVGLNSPIISGIGKFLSVDYGNDLQAAVTAIGSTPTLLNISVPATTDSVVVPDNIVLNFVNTGELTVTSGHTLTVGMMVDPGNEKVFVLADGTAHILFTQNAVSIYNPAWFTGPTDGLDITQALLELFASCLANNGGCIQIPLGIWFTTGDLTIPASTVIQGTVDSAAGPLGTVIRMSSPGDHVFQIGSLANSIRIRDLTIDGDNKAVNGILLTGSAAAGVLFNTIFERIAVNSCFDGIRLHATDGFWQVEQFVLNSVTLDANTHSGFRHDTVNGSCVMNMPLFLVPSNAIGVYSENFGAFTMNQPQFQGLPGRTGQIAFLHIGYAVSITINDGQEEGFDTFLQATFDFGWTQGPINLNNCLVQDYIRMEGQYLLNIYGGKYPRRVIQDIITGQTHICATGYQLFPTDINGVAGNTLIEGNLLSIATIVVQEDYSEGNGGFIQRIPQIYFKPGGFVSLPATDGVIKSLYDVTFVDQVALQFGTAADALTPIHTYSIGRTASNSRAYFKGSQTGSQGYDFDGIITVTNATQEELGTFTGSGTLARITVNSVTGSPNAGYALQADSVDKWILSHYSNKFSLFNVELAKDVMAVDPATNITTFINPVNVTSLTDENLATFSSTQTLARITVNSITGSPNAGYALQANSVDKWILSHYSNRFSLFNTGLVNDAFTVDPANNNMVCGANLTVNKVFSTAQVTAITPGATPAIDASLGNVFTLTPAQDETLSISNMVVGQQIVLRILTSGTDPWVLTFGSGFRSTGTLNTGASDAKYFQVTFECTASLAVESGRTGAM